MRFHLGMRQDLDVTVRREAKQRIEDLLSYYLPQLGPEHAFCCTLFQELRMAGAGLFLAA